MNVKQIAMVLGITTFAWPQLGRAQVYTKTPEGIRTRTLVYNTGGFVSQGADLARDSGAFSAGIDGASGRRGLVAHKGTVYHAFYDDSDGDADIYFRKSTDGRTWTSKIKISKDSSNNTPQFWPVLVAWGGPGATTKLGVLYRDNRIPGTVEQYLVRSLDAGKTWLAPQRVFSTTHQEVTADLAISPEDSLYISVATANNSFWQGMQFSSSSNGGQTWQPWRKVYAGGGQYTRIGNLETGPGGRIWLVASEDQSFKNNLRVVASSDFGKTWTSGVNATPYSGFQDIIYPSADAIAMRRLPNGNLIAQYLYVYRPGPLYKRTHFTVRSTDNGATWASPRRVDDSLANKYLASSEDDAFRASGSLTASASGILYSVYADDRRNAARQGAPLDSLEYDVYISRSTDNGNTWSPGRRVNANNSKLERHGFPAVVVKNTGTTDSVLVAWCNWRYQLPTAVLPSFANEPLKAYPNPVHDVLWVQLPAGQASNQAAKICDATGRLVHTQVLVPAEQSVCTGHLPAGMYVLRVGNSAVRFQKN